MKYFLTADCHFDHANIIKYCNRPFRDVDHMNRELVRRWNERVKDEDIIFHVGDFGFDKGYRWYPKLNGQKYMLKGNHDKNNGVHALVYSLQFKFDNKRCHMVHNPVMADVGSGINFVGHVHDQWKFQKYEGDMYAATGLMLNPGPSYFINVGVDVWNYYPVEIGESLCALQRWRKDNEKEGM